MVKANNITYEISLTMKDDVLKNYIYPNSNPYRDIPEPDMEYIDKQMKTHRHMTMTILHEEYLATNPNGLKYTQFCERYREYISSRKISMHVERKAGEKMEIDWVGDKLKYTDLYGQQKVACFFVSTLGRSTMPYVEAFPDQSKVSFLTGVINALEYYDCECIPARVRTPKDKPSVEKAVFDAVERYIMLKIRNMQFHSIDEINKAVKHYLNEFINKPFQKKEGSRKSVFINEDKTMLKPLPKIKYEIIDIVKAKVNIDYHVEYKKKYYSVPYQLIGKEVEIKAKTLTVEIWHNNERIYTHPRSYKNLYTNLVEHMPEKHQAYNNMNQHTFKKLAKSISPDVLKFINGMFNGVNVE